MKKAKISRIIVSLLFLVVFNAVFFIIGGVEDHPASVWIAYAVIHVSYLMLVLTPLFVKKDKNYMENAAPLDMVSMLHFAFQLIAGIIIMLIAPEGYKVVLIFYIITIAIYLFLFFSVFGANSHTQAQTARQASEVYYIRNYASKVKMLMGRYLGGRLDGKLEKVYDELYTSPTRSCPAVSDIESDIAFNVAELEKAVRAEKAEDAEGIINELLRLIDERNRVLRNNY